MFYKRVGLSKKLIQCVTVFVKFTNVALSEKLKLLSKPTIFLRWSLNWGHLSSSKKDKKHHKKV